MESIPTWSRLPGESDSAWEAFLEFRSLGMDDELGPRKIANLERRTRWSRSTLAKWSARYHWQQRAAAWDRMLDLERKKVACASVREVAEENVEHIHRISELLALELKKFVELSQRSERPVLKASEITKFLDLEQRLKLTADGPPEEAEKAADYSLLSLEEKKKLLRLMRKSRGEAC